jgi:hypothetical protein
LSSKPPPYQPASPFTPFLRRFTDERARDLSETIELYNEVRAAHRASHWSREDAIERANGFVAEWIGKVVRVPDSLVIAQALDRCQTEVLALETTIFSSPEIDWDIATLSLKEQVDLRRFLRAQQHFLGNDERISDQLATALGNVFGGIISELPTLPDGADNPTFTVPLISLVKDPGSMVDRIIGTVCTGELADAGLFTTLQQRFYENTCAASGVMPGEDHRKPLITANESELPPIELVKTYLKGTPFSDLFLTTVPFVLPLPARFEHHWIVAGSGHGKTQTLQSLIGRDLEAVAKGEASIVVIDSQGDLIKNIAGLKLFAEGQPLEGRLCLIDPTDIEYPVQLNLFSLGTERLGSYSQLDRERLLNSVIELYDFVLTALLGAEMTSKQSTLFRFVTRALLHIPNATVHTLRELMETGGYEKHREHIAKLQGTARAFFENEFNSRQFEDTKRQVVRRLYGILENQTFERMFSHPKSKLDMFEEMNGGKVILINAAKDLLKQQGTELFGRFFVALIAQASAERATLPRHKRLPCFVYIDECQDYIAKDANIAAILEQARKQNVGLIVAHQYLTQLSQSILDGLHANTSIKFAGGVSDRDAHALARNMRTTPEFIESQVKGSFAAYVRNFVPNAVSLRIPFGDLEGREQMTTEEQNAVRAQMRARYAVSHKDVEPTVSEPMKDQPPHIDPDMGEHTEASDKW